MARRDEPKRLFAMWMTEAERDHMEALAEAHRVSAASLLRMLLMKMAAPSPAKNARRPKPKKRSGRRR